MFKIIIFLLLLLNTFLIPSAEAQGLYQPVFRHLTTREGLADNGVICVLQDQKGFMWFGTLNGLYKYDGSTLLLVKKNFFKEKGWGNEVNTIVEDRIQHKLWMLVENRLFSMDLHTEQLQEEKVPMKGKLINIYSDKEGRLYLSVQGKGVYVRKEMNSNQWQLLSDLSCRSVISVQEMPNKGIAFLDSRKGIVVCDSTYTQQQTYPLPVGNVISFYIDSCKRLWLGTWSGLYLWNNRLSIFEKFDLLEKLLPLEKKPTYFAVNCIQEDGKDNIFFGTDTGIFVLNKKGNVFNYQSNYHDKSSLSCNFVCDLYFDQEGTLWAGTYSGGVDYISSYSKNFTCYEFINKGMEGHSVSAFAEDKHGNIWIATEDAGLTCYQPSTHKIQNYNPLKRKVNFFDVVGIHCLATSDDWLFIGMVNSGVFAYNQKTQQVIHLTYSSESRRKLSSNTIYALCPLPEEQLAIGTMNGLDIYDFRTDSVEHINDIPSQRISALQIDQKGQLWTCGWYSGIYTRDLDGKWSRFDTSQSIPATCEFTTLVKTHDQLYLGTKNHGVIAYDVAKGTYRSILDKTLQDDIVYKIIPYQNQLWISSSCGLICYDTQKNKGRHYTESDGLKSRQFNLNSGILTSKGIILMGTIYGLNGFNPEQISYNKISPSIVFTDLMINNERIVPNDNKGLLKKSLPYTNRIELAHNQNNLSLKFAALSYTGEGARQYRYKLIPFNSDWIYTTSDQLVLNQLQPGNYQLLVTGCNSDGIWNDKGTLLEIVILPPWWLSWPMFVVYLLLIAGGISIGYHRFKKRQQDKLERLQIKKQEEIYHLKMDFFTNIIHDIRTPLTLIVTPLEMLRKHKETYPFHTELDLIYRNSQRLLNNVNQLMDFRKLEANFEIKPQYSWFDIVDKVTSVVEDFRSCATHKGIDLTLSPHIEEECREIYTDIVLLDKILTNLLSNALKYATSRVNVELSAKNNLCEITVEDDGKGIALSEQEHLFEPFYQVAENLPKDPIGSGVGLYIVKKLLNKMEGSLKMDSDLGKGCKITVTLNCPLSNSASTPQPALAEKEEEEESLSLQPEEGKGDTKWTIAIVDDNEDMRCLLSSLLQPFYEVCTYAHAQALLDDMADITMDLIVSDVMMPGMDGFELCRRLKTDVNTCHIPVVLLTAKIMEQDEIRGMEYGADAYLRKPFSADLFMARIKNLIENKERIAEKYAHDPEWKMGDSITANADRDFVERLDKMIQANLNNDQLTPQFAASEFCMCRTLFFSKIKSVTGMTFSDYLRIYRLKYAIELLKERKYTMVEISAAAGFSSQSYFAQCFKKQFNVTPSEYMRRMTES